MSAFLQAPSAVHLIGIGGSGMQALAAALLADGWRVSGSDLDSAAAGPLCRLGAHVHAGHASANVPADANLAIYSNAVPAENVERVRAAEMGIPLRSYAEMLAELCQGRQTFAVAGTHGKSTTVAMAAAAMVAAGLDPRVICGAVPIGSENGTGGRAGSGPMVVEACEYRANFLKLRPNVAVVLGVEPDHFDFYRSRQQLHEAFAQFAALVPADGLLLLNSDCPASSLLKKGTGTSRQRQIAKKHVSSFGASPLFQQSASQLRKSARCRIATFGLQAGADWTAGELQERRGRYSFRLMHRGRPLAGMALRVPGRHNLLNALAAAALAAEAGAPAEAIAAGISEFRGLHRRLEVLRTEAGSPAGVAFVNDYAHHPTAVRAGLAAVRQMYPGRRVWCVFQPHQASRTAALLDELAASLENAEKLIVADIYRAREGDPKPGEVTAADLAAAVRKNSKYQQVLEEHATDAILSRLQRDLKPGDVLVTMGAGDIGQISQVIIRGLREIVREAEPLAAHTWFRLGGPAEFFAEPNSVEELAALVRRCHEAGLPIRILGGGSNILVRDDGVSGMVLRLSAAPFSQISVDQGVVNAGGGAKLGHVVSTAVREGLAGLETLVGIPGTVGGALHGNAGSRGGDVGQWTCRATVMTRTGEILQREREDLIFSYRQSSLDELVILGCQFQLDPDDPQELTKRMQKLWIVKKASQPLGDQSAGCIFKNPRGISAGLLIDQAGLKGTRIGGAEVNDRHANFIVADADATAADVLRLVELVRSRVAERLGVELETEIEIW